MTNQYLNLTKNSSLAVAIGYPDVVSIANTAINQTGRAVECIAIIMAVYLTTSLTTSAIMNWYKQARSDQGEIAMSLVYALAARRTCARATRISAPGFGRPRVRRKCKGGGGAPRRVRESEHPMSAAFERFRRGRPRSGSRVLFCGCGKTCLPTGRVRSRRSW